jgi:hypothetical protein
MRRKFESENLKRKYQLYDAGVGGKIILNFMYKVVVKAWTEFVW